MPASAAESAHRLHGLDAVRAFALVLGVVYHAAESFAFDTPWIARDVQSSEFLRLFRHASHSFRLPLFFLIAGYFARLIVQRRGVRAFCRDRIQRIAIPFAVGWLVLCPLIRLIWIWGMSVRKDLVLEADELVRYFATLEWVRDFDLTHLWFLHQLLVIYVLALALHGFGIRWVPAGGRRRLDVAVATLARSRFAALWLGLALVPALLAMREWRIDTPHQSLWPQPAATLLYGTIFGVGWLMHRQPALLESLTRGWKAHLALGLLLVVPTHRLPLAAGADVATPDPAHWLRLVHAPVYAWMMGAFVLGFLGFFVGNHRRPSAAWRYVADASYWVYIVHLPLVMVLQVLVAGVDLHWTLKFPAITGVVLAACFLSYHTLVRSTFIGAQLNGRRYPRGWPFARPALARAPGGALGDER